MAKIISTNEQLTALIPNTLISVKGETPLFDKLAPFLALAEDWVRNTFTSEPTYNTICGYTDTNPIRITTARLVVADAMRRAIPSLDVVLTPNGFATVGTQNLVAASKMRVDRLVGSMLTHRDDCIAALLPELPGASKWLNSNQAAFFGATLFPDLSLTDQIPILASQATSRLPKNQLPRSRWEWYLELRSQILDLEASLAEEWFSPELMDVLRRRNLARTLADTDRRAVADIQAHILGYLRTGSFNTRRLADTLTYIRRLPEHFPEWHNSATAQLFSPPIFQNKKKSPGYFF